MEAVPIVILIASAVIGFVVGRWWTVPVPIASLSAYYVGLNAGWWGHGVGDGWQFAMALFMGVGVLAASLGVAARTLVGRRAPTRPY